MPAQQDNVVSARTMPRSLALSFFSTHRTPFCHTEHRSLAYTPFQEFEHRLGFCLPAHNAMNLNHHLIAHRLRSLHRTFALAFCSATIATAQLAPSTSPVIKSDTKDLYEMP